jgi:hypothetical protein
VVLELLAGHLSAVNNPSTPNPTIIKIDQIISGFNPL